MSAAAGIGALSISTIEGTYRGNEKTNLYIFIDYYIILYFCQKKAMKTSSINLQITYIKKSIWSMANYLLIT